MNFDVTALPLLARPFVTAFARRLAVIIGVLMVLGAVFLGGVFASRSGGVAKKAQSTPTVTVTVVPATPASAAATGPQLLQPIIIQPPSTGGSSAWIAIVAAVGGLLSGLGAMAAAWVKVQGQDESDEQRSGTR
jgi:hypothetical protein